VRRVSKDRDAAGIAKFLLGKSSTQDSNRSEIQFRSGFNIVRCISHNQDIAKVPLQLLEFRELASDDLGKETLKLSPSNKHNPFLNARIDPVVLLNIQTEGVQGLLRNADLLADADYCSPINDGHGPKESVCGERHKQHWGHQDGNDRFPMKPLHKSPSGFFPLMTPLPADAPSQACKYLPAQTTPGAL